MVTVKNKSSKSRLFFSFNTAICSKSSRSKSDRQRFHYVDISL